MILPHDLVTSIVLLLGAVLVHAAVLITVALGIERHVPTPAWRELLWRIALFGALVTAPMQNLLVPLAAPWPIATIELASPDAAARAQIRSSSMPGSTGSTQGPLHAEAGEVKAIGRMPARAADAQPGISSWPVDFWQLALMAWLAVAICLTAHWFTRRSRVVSRLRRRVIAVDQALTGAMLPLAAKSQRKNFRVCVCKELAVPIAVYPAEICVPERAVAELTRGQLLGLLAHEMAHLRRRDALWQAASVLVCSVFWFQPLLRIAAPRLAALAEEQCDRWAVRRTHEPLNLARALLAVASWIRSDADDVVYTAAASGGLLSQRIERLADEEEAFTSEPSAAHRIVVTATAFLLAVLALPTVAIDRQSAVGHKSATLMPMVSDASGGRFSERFAGAVTHLEAKPAWLVFGIHSAMRASDAVINDSAGYDTKLLKAPALGKRFLGSDWKPLPRSSQRVEKDVIFMLRVDASGAIDRIATIDAAYGEDFGKAPVQWLGEVTGADAHELLMHLYQTSSDPELRGEYTSAISLLTNVDGIPDWLRERATSSDVVPVRAAAAEALHWYEFPGRAELLGRIARDDPDPRVWSSAITALQVIGDEGRPVLKDLARSHPDEAVRDHAASALDKSGG